MKKLTRILTTLMMVCTLIPATPVFAGGNFFNENSWDDLQRMFRSGGEITYFTDRNRANYTISVTTSAYIRKSENDKKAALYCNNTDYSMFAINNDDVSFSIDSAISLEVNGSATGGIVYVKANNCTIDGLNIVQGITKGKYAGAIYVEGNNCTIQNCDFTNCSSAYCGGAIYVYGDDCTIKDCTFNKCSSQYGGAIYLEGYSTDIIGCTFTDCSATKDGGAIYANDDAEIKENCTFTNNTATGYGGSICDDNGPGQVVISNCNFTGGSSKTDGGIWVYGWGDAKVEKCTPGDSSYYYDIEDIDSTLVSSILSEGNIWIIGGIGVIAMAAIVLIVLKRRKKTA